LLSDPRIDVNVQDHIGKMSPLHLAVQSVRITNVKLLLEHNQINKGLLDHANMTPLMLAENLEEENIEELLIILKQ